MTLVKFNPGRTMRRENSRFNFDSFANDFFNYDLAHESNQATQPMVNIIENEDNLSLELAIPGYEKDDFSISVENKILNISLNKKEEKSDKKYLRLEYDYQGFSRNFKIGNSINPEKIKAVYNQGILSVVLEKKEEDKLKPSRMIEVK